MKLLVSAKMEISRNTLIRKYFVGCVVAFISIFGFSCSEQNSSLKISRTPVFSEMDTFKTQYGNKVITKYDYYLVTGLINNQNELKLFLDSVSKGIFKNRNKPEYDNYLLSFYRKDADVSEETVANTPNEYQYKIFVRFTPNFPA